MIPVGGTVGYGHFTFQVCTYLRLPIRSPLYFNNEHIQGTGAFWNVSRDGCRMNANVPLHP
jgi:hypothetical protein